MHCILWIVFFALFYKHCIIFIVINTFYTMYCLFILLNFETRCRLTIRPTDHLTDQPSDWLTDIVTYRAAIAAKNLLGLKEHKCANWSWLRTSGKWVPWSFWPDFSIKQSEIRLIFLYWVHFKVKIMSRKSGSILTKSLREGISFFSPLVLSGSLMNFPLGPIFSHDFSTYHPIQAHCGNSFHLVQCVTIQYSCFFFNFSNIIPL